MLKKRCGLRFPPTFPQRVSGPAAFTDPLRLSSFSSRLLLSASLLALAGPAMAAPGIQARRDSDFLNSIGSNSALAARGEDLQHTIGCARYVGVRWFRAGLEGNLPARAFLELHRQAGVRFSWSPGSGGSDLPRLLSTAREVARGGALLAFEGPNEPNNWGITYGGHAGGRNLSWVPVAKLQSDLYRFVKRDPVLKKYPVWSITENGAETDNVGLQFLTIPHGAGTVMPAGTRYADYANLHNYFYHPNSPGMEDNKTWNAADPTSACRVDGLYGNYGRTWGKHYSGYSQKALDTLPRVTTETGTTIGGAITEQVQALNILTLYLDQFKRGFSYTALYLLRDRVDEAGNQSFGFYRPDYTPRQSAVYLHNLTTILADHGSIARPGRLAYSIFPEPATVHDLLLQKSSGAYELVVWDERVHGSDTIQVDLGGVNSLVRFYDPTVGTAPLQVFRDVQRLSVSLTNHPSVIEIPRLSRGARAN